MASKHVHKRAISDRLRIRRPESSFGFWKGFFRLAFPVPSIDPASVEVEYVGFDSDAAALRADFEKVIAIADEQPSGWQPVPGTETAPMVLVSWFGANAYSLWANAQSWESYRTATGFLPSEAQWEYAARDAFPGETAAHSKASTLIGAQHERGAHYTAETMPMAPVHTPLGVSRFGLHHMAGNIWHWCRDWYAADFYQRPESWQIDPVQTAETGVRSERGGSWVGPVELCRTTYRRGRPPFARGRCLGFRCISPASALPR